MFNCNVLPYKAADSALEIAMDRFINATYEAMILNRVLGDYQLEVLK